MEKKREKRGIDIIAFSIILLFSISIVSAGFSEWFKSITGRVPQNMSIKIKGINPAQIVYVSQIPSVSPQELSFTTITFEVHMYDRDGVKDLNHTSVSANISMLGETTRFSDICTRQLPDINPKTGNYSCAVNMWYWDGAGGWNIIVEGKDIGNGTWVYNTSTIFNYNILQAMVISPEVLTWPEIIPEAVNQTPGNYTIVNNRGNYDGEITMTSINLLGEDEPSEAIYAENFTTDIETGGPGCVLGGCIECDGTPLANNTAVGITGSNSNPGNLSAGSGAGQEQLYYCIPQIPLLPSQTYSTATGGSWLISY